MIITGDCIAAMKEMPENSVDSVCTDPPYALEFMGRSWDGADGFRRSLNPNDAGRDDVFGRTSRTSPEYRGGNLFQQWCEAWGREALRVTKPGGYLLAFGGTRTHHRLVCGLEDAGWIIRDELQWNYLQGFPKGKANLKPAHEPIVLARKPGPLRHLNIDDNRIPVSGPTTTMDAWDDDANLCVSCAAAAASQGRLGTSGTRGSTTPKPVVDWLSEQDGSADTVASLDTSASAGSVMTGRSNTSSSTARSGKMPTVRSRPGTSSTTATESGTTTASRTCRSCGATSTATTTIDGTTSTLNDPLNAITPEEAASGGRWPSNVLVLQEDVAFYDEANAYVVGSGAGEEGTGISRVFYVPKADRADREPVLRGQLETAVWSDGREVAADYPSQRGKTSRENGHPTVKPTDLMRHLVRLVTPVGGTVLDCFLGSGTTAIAAEMEGFAWIGIEKEPEYVAIAEARLNGVQRGLGLDVPAPTAPQKRSTVHWPKDRTAGSEGWGFTGQTGLEQRYDKPPEEAA